MIAAEPEINEGGGIGRSGGGGPIKTAAAPTANAFMSNWGPLASNTDMLYVPGFSDRNQGVFNKTTATAQQPASQLSQAPPATKQAASKPPATPFAPSSQHELFGAFLQGIMTPSQYYASQQQQQNALLMAGMRQ